MLIFAPLGGSPFAPLCSFTFLYTFCSSAASFSLLPFLICRHSHFLCPSSPHLKHLGFSLMISCLLNSFTPHCITQLFNTLNLLPPTIFFFCFSPFLHFWMRYPNLPHCLHILSSLLSNFTLNLARACLLLSMLLII